MKKMTYTTDAAEFATGFRGDVKRLQTRVRALKIAEGLIAQGWQVSIADEAISTSSIYFNAESPEGRVARVRIADHGRSGQFASTGLRGSGMIVDVARSSKLDAVVAAVIRRAA